jgi:hypothetical protein
MTTCNQRNAKRLAPVLTLAMLSQTGCAAALWGNLLIVILTIAIFVGTIRLGNGDEDR